MYDTLMEIVTESWLVLGQMAPYLLFGFLVAGVLSVYVSSEWVERHLGGRGFASVLKASLFGVPLPLCSCGVIPVSVSIRRHGASRAATTAFLLSTPQTGVDSIAVTYALLGPIFAIFRPIAALFTGLIGGGMVQFFGRPNRVDMADEPSAATCTETCCTGEDRRNVLTRILRYGLVTLPRDIGLALLVGILIAGLMAVIVPQDHLATYIGGGLLSILLMMMAGVPVYVCATASVPIAAGFMYMGVSPGAALAFLIAGPATNAATFTTIWKVLGRRTAILYLLTIAVSALGSGLLLDWLMPIAEMSLPQLAAHTHLPSGGGWLYHASAILLLAVLIFSYRSKAHHKSDIENKPKRDDNAEVPSEDCCSHTPTVNSGCNHCAEDAGHKTGQRNTE
ncbi:MAG: SO_0444 family Cu/Zn efflux transporter [candidate division Zixibacteria bacterium]|nr:SO_0444 family Cu/Zn efflux transporter [candidate division Zixibacteria bacterium]